jgi:hypothetical protein
LDLENDTVSCVYDMAGDDKERVVYDVGKTWVFICSRDYPNVGR